MVCVCFHRQLEAIIRISEALAKMSLSPFALDTHVDEALRLFQVSTLEAAHSGRLAGKWPWRWRMEWWVEFNKGIRWHLGDSGPYCSLYQVSFHCTVSSVSERRYLSG